MSLEYCTLNIQYDARKEKFKVRGDINREGQREIIEIFLREQMGKGEDKNEPNKRDFYHIGFRWFPEDDTVEISSDTGNKGLRDGILLKYLASLNKSS